MNSFKKLTLTRTFLPLPASLYFRVDAKTGKKYIQYIPEKDNKKTNRKNKKEIKKWIKFLKRVKREI